MAKPSKIRNFGLDISNAPSTSTDIRKRPKLKIKANPLKDVASWDRENLNDPQHVSLYAGSITNHFLRLEQDDAYVIDEKYMQYQKDLSPKMRRILINWLIQVHLQYKMNEDVLHLCVNIIDRFLSIFVIKRQQLQLVGAAALLIASKFEEIYPPSAHKLIAFSEYSFTLEDILNMEGTILESLEFKLIGPSSHRFFERYAQIFKFNQKCRFIGEFLLNLALLEYNILKFKPSVLAAATIVLVLKSEGINLEETELQEKMTYDKSEMESCCKILCFLMFKCTKSLKFPAIRKKYGAHGLYDVLTFFE